jgi:hypothetical protein
MHDFRNIFSWWSFIQKVPYSFFEYGFEIVFVCYAFHADHTIDFQLGWFNMGFYVKICVCSDTAQLNSL